MSDLPPKKQPSRPKEDGIARSIILKDLMEGVVLDHFDLEAVMKKAHELATKQSDTVQKAEKKYSICFRD